MFLLRAFLVEIGCVDCSRYYDAIRAGKRSIILLYFIDVAYDPSALYRQHARPAILQPHGYHYIRMIAKLNVKRPASHLTVVVVWSAGAAPQPIPSQLCGYNPGKYMLKV